MINWKRYIPAGVKLFIKIKQQRCRDIITGNRKLFAKHTATANNFHELISIDQAIRKNNGAENKIHNLSLAINKLHNVIIYPNEIFSFWHLVNAPSKKKGYKKSRSIINGKLEAATGGGLCQLSGLIYYLALQAGLTIIERHAHSLDIYKEEERFTPLGSDATVTYGHKDLRFKNELPFPVILQLQLSPTLLSGKILSKERSEANKIEFVYSNEPHQTLVTTLLHVNDRPVIISENIYRLLTYL